MGREVSAVKFWSGFDKQAGLVGEMAARVAGRGKAVDRLNQVRKTLPHAFKPQNILGQIIQNPAKGLANAAARHSATWRSPKERILRATGYGLVGAGAAGAAIRKSEHDPDYNRLKELNDRQR